MITIHRKIESSRVVNIEDIRSLARNRLPRVVFDYLDGGAEAEVTLRDNCSALQRVTFRPRQAVAVADCTLRTSVLGTEIAMPLMLAPVGYSRVMHSEGEIAAARVAGMSGIGYILSTISGYSLEEVKAATSGPAWYQLYLLGGRTAAECAIQRARDCGYSALVITLDTAVAGVRERDLRNGMKKLLDGNILQKLLFLPQLLAHPSWLTSFLLDGGIPHLKNVIVDGDPMPLTDVASALSRSVVTWDDIPWIRKVWGGPIVMKGVLSGEDAIRAVDHGADAIIVSNHGGRQLDCVSATIRALSEVISAVNGRVEVLVDGGIRRGADVVKALCMGARAVLIGRAYAYGLAAGGHLGVVRVLEIFRNDIERTLRLLGCNGIQELNRSFVRFPREWVRDDEVSVNGDGSTVSLDYEND